MNKYKKKNSYKALLKHSQENCEFCDRVFRNRFECIIHTASHIIIPLIQQSCHECVDCHCYFVSIDDLIKHRVSEHSVKIETVSIANIKEKSMSEHKIEARSTVEFDDIVKKESQDSIMISKKVKRNNSEDLENYTKAKNSSYDKIKKESCKIKVENSNEVINEYEENYNDFTNRIRQRSVIMYVEPGVEKFPYNGTLSIDESNSIVSRLKFEDDDDLKSEGVLNDLLTECKVQVKNTLRIPYPKEKKVTKQRTRCIEHDANIDLVKDYKLAKKRSTLVENRVLEYGMFGKLNDVYENVIVDGYECDKFIGHSVENIQCRKDKFVSIHYSNLLKPGIFNCRYCTKSYPNRFSLIQHEPKHIKIKKPRPLLCTFCDKYIAGNHLQLHKHIKTYHLKADVSKKHETHTCKRCGLKFRKYIFHVRNYHPLDCPKCGKEFKHHEQFESEEHREACNPLNALYQSSKIFNICDLCYSFLKDTKLHKYMILATVNEIGVRYPCSRCGKKCFDIKIVQLINKVKRKYQFKERKPITNEERLKKLQHRLKKINLLNKFYIVVSLTQYS